MQKYFGILALLTFATPTMAKVPFVKAINVKSNVEDFVAPVVPNESSLGAKPVGLIFYDLDDDALKVVDSSGTSIDLTLPQSVVAVGSGGTERIERATLLCAASSSITRQSGSWISSIGPASSGDCAVTFAEGTFSAITTCTVSAGNGGAVGASVHTVSASGLTIGSFTTNTTVGSSSMTLHLICMGAR